MPDWVKHAIWWQVYPLGFTSAEATGEPEAGAAGEPDEGDARPVTHRLGQLAGWLDYAVNLGASGVALGPVFASQTHGYDTTDHFRIDPRLGDEGDFAGLVEAAHARGLRVLLDGVFNHVGRGFPAFQRVLEQGPDCAGGLVVPADLAGGLAAGHGAGVRHVRGTRSPGGAQPRRAGRRRLRSQGDESLAGRGRGRLAAGRGVRRAHRLLGPGGAPGPGRASRGVPGRRGDPR